MIAWILSQLTFPTFYAHRKELFIALLVISYPITYYIGYGYGYFDGKARVEYVTVEKYIERKEARENKKKEVRALDNDALLRRYCKWVSDMPYDKCLREYRFVE